MGIVGAVQLSTINHPLSTSCHHRFSTISKNPSTLTPMELLLSITLFSASARVVLINRSARSPTRFLIRKARSTSERASGSGDRAHDQVDQDKRRAEAENRSKAAVPWGVKVDGFFEILSRSVVQEVDSDGYSR